MKIIITAQIIVNESAFKVETTLAKISAKILRSTKIATSSKIAKS